MKLIKKVICDPLIIYNPFTMLTMVALRNAILINLAYKLA